jgi:hypothetical protein
MHESVPSACLVQHNNSQAPRNPVFVGILSSAEYSQDGGEE